VAGAYSTDAGGAAAPAAPSSASDSSAVSVIVPRRKVRVLFINDTARNGGPGRSLFYILHFLDPDVVHRAVVLPRSGVISELYASRGVTEELLFENDLVENPIEPWNRPMERNDFDASLPVRSVRAVGNVVRATRAMARLTSVVRRGNYDLIYCNGTNADFAGGALARTASTPAIWHVRYTSLPKAVRGVHDRLAASRGVKRIICVSKASAELFPHCPEKVRVIHNALDVSEFELKGVTPTLRKELQLAPGTVVFGSQGRILPRKGYAEMVQAGRRALDQMTEDERTRVHFAVLGDTPEDYRPDHLAECRALVKTLRIEDKFTFLGFKTDVKPYVADFDVAVVPSVYADPLPRAVIESMALGKPVIAFDVGGVAEMLKDGTTGSLVRGPRPGHGGREEPADVEGLATQMLRYLRDPALRDAQGRAGRARVERDFDGATQARRIQNEIVRAAGLASEPAR
jgi:glycosyltransferase involved in cell wall biosynthesis